MYVKSFDGANIKDIHSYAKPSVERKPNLVILLIGTNDLSPKRNEEEKSAVQTAQGVIEWTIALKMAARNFLPRCTAFYDRIPIKSLRIRNSNALHLGKKFLAAIFSAIVYWPRAQGKMI